MSISALMVDAHSILAQQELHHLQVFSIGARTVTQDSLSPQHESQVKINAYKLIKISMCSRLCPFICVSVLQIINTVCETIPVKYCLAEYVLL